MSFFAPGSTPGFHTAFSLQVSWVASGLWQFQSVLFLMILEVLKWTGHGFGRLSWVEFCLLFFSWLDSSYRFGGRIPQGEVPFSSCHVRGHMLSTWQAGVCQFLHCNLHTLPFGNEPLSPAHIQEEGENQLHFICYLKLFCKEELALYPH